MPKHVVSFSLSKEAIQRIDKICTTLGISRSQFIEETIQNIVVPDIIHEIHDLQVELRKMLQELP